MIMYCLGIITGVYIGTYYDCKPCIEFIYVNTHKLCRKRGHNVYNDFYNDDDDDDDDDDEDDVDNEK